MGDHQSTRGILRPRAGFEHFELDRAEAPNDLRSIVSGLWTVRWDLPQGETFDQEILPFPNVNLAFEDGVLNLHGPTTERFVAKLRGTTWVAGIRFRPAGFFAIAKRPMSDIVQQVWPAHEALQLPSPDFPNDAEQARVLLIAHVRACLEKRKTEDSRFELAELERTSQWVELASTDRSIMTAADLARRANISVRTLHRTLEKHVGLSSKWIVKRARIQQAAESVATGQEVNWAALANELGYHDQAHLIHDFKAQIGLTPQAYAQQCAESRAR